jgi:hypothetical protein
VNRVLAAEGKPAANHKRRHGLLLQRHTGRRKGRLHEGKVVVKRRLVVSHSIAAECGAEQASAQFR